MASENEKLFEHDYDGIREYDNPLPPWWVYLFWITILWSGVYVVYYHVFAIGDNSTEEYIKEYDPMWNRNVDPNLATLKLIESGRSASYILTGEVSYNYEALTDEASLAGGKDIFLKNCAACHNPEGGGQIGPNLTDQYWISGGGINNVVKTITEGVPAKGMIAWNTTLSQEEILQVGSYLLTLQGTNPPNPKGPEGTIWVE